MPPAIRIRPTSRCGTPAADEGLSLLLLFLLRQEATFPLQVAPRRLDPHLAYLPQQLIEGGGNRETSLP